MLTALAHLPATGAGLGLGGLLLSQVSYLVGPLALVATGAALVRARFRRGRSISD